MSALRHLRVRCSSSVTSLREKAAVVASHRRIDSLLQRFRPPAAVQYEKVEEPQILRPRKSFDSSSPRKLKKSPSQRQMRQIRGDEKVPALPSRPLSMLRTASTPDLRLRQRKGSADSDDRRDPFHLELLLSFPKPPSSTPKPMVRPQASSNTLPLRGQLPKRTSSLSGSFKGSSGVRVDASFAVPTRCMYADLLEAAGIDSTPLPPDVRWNVKGAECPPAQRPTRTRLRAQTLSSDTYDKPPMPAVERPLLLTRKLSTPRLVEVQTVCK